MQNFLELSRNFAYYYEVRLECTPWNNLRLTPIIPRCLAMHYNQALQHVYEDILQSSGSLKITPINREILINAAKIRAKTESIHLPDAIHLATACMHHCSSFITNDKRLKKVPDINVIILSGTVNE